VGRRTGRDRIVAYNLAVIGFAEENVEVLAEMIVRNIVDDCPFAGPASSEGADIVVDLNMTAAVRADDQPQYLT
jgi:hypothetical protein